MQQFNAAFATARDTPSDENLMRVKSAFLRVLPNADAPQKRQLESAKTALEVVALFNTTLSRGMLVRFKARTVFKDGDDNDDDDKPDTARDLEVWTPFGDCGFEFQAGETYLVYAGGEEGSGEFFVDKCSRTRRLSEAGDDLSYLFFFKNQPEESTRLEGFATTDRRAQLEFGKIPAKITEPAAGIIVELQSARQRRFAETDASGRFVFDGLSQGDYQVSAFRNEYRFDAQRLIGPQSLTLDAKGCARHLLVIPKSNP